MTEDEIERSVPEEYANLPPDFWDEAKLVIPPSKRPVSIRVDEDVLEWFKDQGPKYQTRMNAVLRSYMAQIQGNKPRKRPARRAASR